MATETTQSSLLDTREAAPRARLSKSTLERLRQQGEGPPYFVVSRNRVLYDSADLDAWVRSRRVDPRNTRKSEPEKETATAC
jgi:predicted DNA-binding transcriptional regulator AlpA